MSLCQDGEGGGGGGHPLGDERRKRTKKKTKKEKLSTRIHWDPRGVKNRAAPLVPRRERRRKKEVLRESKGGQRQRAQVMVLSCWCHRQNRAALPPGCHLHRTQYPLYSQYHAAIFRWCSRLTAPLSLLSRPPVTPPLFPPSAVPSLQNSAVSTVWFIFAFFSLSLCFCPTWALALGFLGARSFRLTSQEPSFCHCRKL